ncbi:hypothetical protein ACOMHN_051879 [Nucella lapillus]
MASDEESVQEMDTDDEGSESESVYDMDTEEEGSESESESVYDMDTEEEGSESESESVRVKEPSRKLLTMTLKLFSLLSVTDAAVSALEFW